MSDEPGAIDTKWEYLGYTSIILIIGILVGGFYIASNPTLDERVRYNYFGDDPYGNDTLNFTRGQIEQMNRAYSDRLEEYGWCLDIDGEEVTYLSHPQTDEDSEKDSIAFSCYNYFDARSHNHPSYFGVPELSDTDKKTLLTSRDLYSCVMSDPVPDYRYQNPASFKCYKNPVDDPLEEDEVVELNQYEFEQVQINIIDEEK